ncbi:MAG: hypothetical protein KZQ70_13890 [gamma proteobacterium symbiont of Lucinoma myriamae]|nr:hypothetical protein [gamma proteobacterium symbiont of Lucinoma myriamae]MCU7818073.1 hypothetical protein [gamma proteobacterium symbiont of Lucinoma myriamae]MCU7833375.1 hypothetical protein [gamma proteobacterium symbiont of Lucinoma myriamae]
MPANKILSINQVVAGLTLCTLCTLTLAIPPVYGESQSLDENTVKLFEAHFDTDTDGFTYVDDAFRSTNNPAYARGIYTEKQGYKRSSGLRVVIGGRDKKTIVDMSGGWERSFSLEKSASVTLSFRYRLAQNKNYAVGAISEALVSIDDNLMGQDGSDYLAQFEGDGLGGRGKNTRWKQISLNLGELSAGEHSLKIGGFNNIKTSRRQTTNIYIDDVVMESNTTTTPPPTGIGTSFIIPPEDPTLSIDGMVQMVREKGIHDIETLMAELPESLNASWTLMENSNGLRDTSIQHPSLIMYGADARFLLSVGTNSADPLNDILEMAELNPKTGQWSFSILDFGKATPELTKDVPICQTCRVVWGN